MLAQISLPRKMLIGGGSTKQIGSLLKSMDLKYPLIVTDSFLSKSGALFRVEEALKNANVPYDVFSDTIPDPTTVSVDKCRAALTNDKFDSIIALGLLLLLLF